MTKAINIYIGLGSNVGDRTTYLKRAREEMEKNNMVILQQSSIFQTEAWGFKDQPSFLNQVIEISSTLLPEQLLRRMKFIEKKLGRRDRKKWREREIDLDIIYYGDQIIHTPDLHIPHQYVRNRNFVLIPLAEIAGEFCDPETGKTVLQMVSESEDKTLVHQYFTE